jgi:hypothetical protein
MTIIYATKPTSARHDGYYNSYRTIPNKRPEHTTNHHKNGRKNYRENYRERRFQEEAIMREEPYPARFYGRQFDEFFMNESIMPSPTETPFSLQPLHRVLLLLMTFYLCCALFLIFVVTSYAAPLENATISSQTAASCVGTTTGAAH